jgi:hypothetical protein
MTVRCGDLVRFVCDGCGQLAGAAEYEDQALRNARLVAKTDGWKWEHPGWGLVCDGCQKSRGQ